MAIHFSISIILEVILGFRNQNRKLKYAYENCHTQQTPSPLQPKGRGKESTGLWNGQFQKRHLEQLTKKKTWWGTVLGRSGQRVCTRFKALTLFLSQHVPIWINSINCLGDLATTRLQDYNVVWKRHTYKILLNFICCLRDLSFSFLIDKNAKTTVD